MRMLLRLLGVALLAIPTWASRSEFGTPPSERALEHMMRADRVWIYRMIDWNQRTPGGRLLHGSRMIRGYEAVDSTQVPVEWARRLVPIVASPSAWNALLRKGEPEKIAVVRFLTSRETTDVDLSFEDDAIAVHSAGQAWGGRSEKERRRIIRWLQGAFPGENRIEGLREKFKGYDYEPPKPLRTPVPRGWKLTDSPDETCLILKVLVDSNGLPKYRERALGPGAAERSALEVVKTWTFSPAFQEGRPVEDWVTFALKRAGGD